MTNETIKAIIAFRDARDWARFHTVANLAQSISIESAELLELFQWGNSPTREAIADELADIAIYLNTLAHDIGINMESAVLSKLALNEKRYPVAKCKGRSDKYTEYQDEV